MKRYSIRFAGGKLVRYNKKDFVDKLFEMLGNGIKFRLSDNFTRIYQGHSSNWRDRGVYIFNEGYGRSACRYTKSDLRLYMNEKYLSVKVID
jgi:hypothetical protein